MFKFLPNHLKKTDEETRENISAEKEVDERNTNTSKVTNTSEVCDGEPKNIENKVRRCCFKC